MAQPDMTEDTEKSILARLLIEQKATNFLLARLIDYSEPDRMLEKAYEYVLNGKVDLWK